MGSEQVKRLPHGAIDLNAFCEAQTNTRYCSRSAVFTFFRRSLKKLSGELGYAPFICYEPRKVGGLIDKDVKSCDRAFPRHTAQQANNQDQSRLAITVSKNHLNNSAMAMTFFAISPNDTFLSIASLRKAW